jgi:hypothetical protein
VFAKKGNSQAIKVVRFGSREREMEKGVLSMMILVCFLRMATTIALDTVSEATISYSMKLSAESARNEWLP